MAYPFWNVAFRRGFRCGYTVVSRVERIFLYKYYMDILERTIGNADTIEFATESIANKASLTVTSTTRSIFLGSLRWRKGSIEEQSVERAERCNI